MGIFQNNLMGAAAAAASAGGADFYDHQIVNSVRLGDSGYLKRTPSGAGNRATWTFSTWIKITKLGTSTNSDQPGGILNAGSGSGNQDTFYRLNYSQTKLFSSSGAANFFFSTGLYRDTSTWYHVVWKHGSGTSTVYVNGVAASGATASVSGNTAINNSVQHVIGGSSNTLGETPLKAYLAETIMIDGTALDPDSFGETKNGVWIPKDASGLTFGTNGFHLKYESSSDLGNDSSGNNNDWTAVNLSTHDQMLDTPTFNSDSNGGNFATLNPLNTRGSTAVATQLTEGNLKWTPGATQDETSGTMSIGASGVDKVYIEVYCENNSDTGWFGVYDQKDGTLMNAVVQSTASSVRFKPRTGQKVTAGTSSNYIGNGSEVTITDTIFQMAVDMDAGKIWWGKANAWGSDGGGSPTDSNVAFTTLNTDGTYLLFTHTGGASIAQPDWVFNFGQDGTFAGNKTAQGNSDDTGYGNFYYSPPTGFKALCSGNVSVVDEVDPAQTDDDYPQKLVDATIYTGTGSEKAVAVGWQPNLTWVKERGGANDNKLTDSVRGATKALESNTNTAETTDAQGVKAFTSTGFTLGTDAVYNNNTDTYVAWNWKEGADYGLDIVTYSGTLTGSGVVNISHSLGAIPECLWHMRRTGAGGAIRHKDLTDANYIISNNDTMSGSSGTGWGKSAQGSKSGNGNMTALGTSSTFTTNYTGLLNENGNTYVTYVWRGIEGFSKFGSYVANGSSTDNAFVYLGFRPAIIITKGTRYGDGYNIHDNATSPFNLADTVLQPNTSSAELSNYNIDMLSNGFKVRDGDGDLGSNGVKYIYMAWAENPFKYATAR